MGYDVESLEGLTGPIFMGAGTSMPFVWVWVSVVLCVLACIVGSRHELAAYRKIRG